MDFRLLHSFSASRFYADSFSKQPVPCYLEALFFCFILDFILERTCGSLRMRLLVNVVLLNIGIVASRILGSSIPLVNPFRDMIWFWFGKHIDTIKNYLGRQKLWNEKGIFALFLLQIILFVISKIFNRGFILINNVILPMLMLPTCYFLGEVLSQKKSIQ